MRVSVILGHPRRGSFNHAIAETVVRTLRDSGHKVIFHDLYAEGFDAVLSPAEIPATAALDPVVKRHCDEISGAEGIIIIHPNWWGQPPAIVKGWVDRVFRAGVAYRFMDGDKGDGIPVALLKATTALVFNTADTPAQREKKAFGDPLETLWKRCIFGLCGVKTVHRRVYSVVVTSAPEQREGWLRDVRNTVSTYFPFKRHLYPGHIIRAKGTAGNKRHENIHK